MPLDPLPPAPPTIDALPPAPNPTMPTPVFKAAAFAHVAALEPMRVLQNAQAAAVNLLAGHAYASAGAADVSRAEAEAAAAAASAHANATKWSSGSDYTDGDVVWSPISRLSYRRIGDGAGTTDPSADPTHWFPTDRTPVGALLAVTGNVAAVSFATYVMPDAGAYTVTLPPDPTQGEWVGFIPPAIAVSGQKVGRNGNKLIDQEEDMDLDVDGVPFRLVYLDARGWVMAA